MRRTSARILLVAAAVAAAVVCLRPADAADITDDEFKALLEQDSKIIAKATAAVGKASGKDKKVVEKNAGSGIKSSAIIIAGYANARIDGKNPTTDAKAAGVRDLAIQIFQAADKKDFTAAGNLAKGLADAKPAAEAKKIDLTKTFEGIVNKDVMDNFKKTSQYGTNVEDDIMANAEKPTATPADAGLMANRVLVMGEYNKTVVKAENAADKKKWEEYNDKMIKAGIDLLAASKKKASAADLKKIFATLNSSCVACHDDFK
jgi:cytochrome c556